MSQHMEFVENKPYKLNVRVAEVNSKTCEFVTDSRLSEKLGVTLKKGIDQAVEGERDEPDLVFSVQAPIYGRYVVQSYAVTDSEGAELMKKATNKFESMFMRIQIDDQRPTKRVIYVPWNRPNQRIGLFTLTGNEQKIKIWLPRGIRLDFLQLRNYIPPKIPDAAVNYKPKIIPPSTHPRLWVTEESLPIVKKRLRTEEHKVHWEKVKQTALAPFDFDFDRDKEITFDAELEVAAEMKAFYYLMTGDERIGREAIDLMLAYLPLVEFGNLLDITREIGRVIYIASEVYDWGYDLLSYDEKQLIIKNLMRLADEMEIGWPPFRTGITNGHGNEAQVNRDLLAMSIAIYNEDPLPYQYVSFAILETLVPMRKFEYQSPRHSQGIHYASYRFAWELHAAWMFYRMTGTPVFDDNIKEVCKYWLYMRTPNGQMLRDGDGMIVDEMEKNYYWKSPLVMFLMSSYASNPIIKGELLRQGGLSSAPVLYLLLNDPELKAEQSLEDLPLSIDFGPVLSSMIVRTGWNIGEQSDDVVAEIKGGGYHFGNHQHADAGSFQLFYRGFQLGDIGLYRFNGTPYDMGFNKRSISHSMMLAVDPDETFYRSHVNDGGTRFNQRAPRTVEELKNDPQFHNGRVVSVSFGPSEQKPLFSYFSVDLSGAYSDKVLSYTRSFMFMNLENKKIPAIMIMTDDMLTSNKMFKKFWQINTRNKPQITYNGVVLQSRRGDDIGKTHVQMLIPGPENREIKIFSGLEANHVFGSKLEAPISNHPDAMANRIMFSPKYANSKDRFLTVFQVVDGNNMPLPVTYEETRNSYVIHVADRIVCMSNSSNLIDQSFIIHVPEKGNHQVILAGMKAGDWNIRDQQGTASKNVKVSQGKNTVYFEGKPGSYLIRPIVSSRKK